MWVLVLPESLGNGLRITVTYRLEIRLLWFFNIQKYDRGAPQFPALGPRARNAFGQRTGPAVAADIRDGIVAVNILEYEDLIDMNGAYIEDELNRDREAAGLPPQAFANMQEVLEEASRAQKAKIEELEMGMTSCCR